MAPVRVGDGDRSGGPLKPKLLNGSSEEKKGGKKEKAKYEFVRVVKLCFMMADRFEHYITFEARPRLRVLLLCASKLLFLLDSLRMRERDVTRELGHLVYAPSHNFLRLRNTSLAYIFRLEVDWLTEKMSSNNFTVSSMHGDMPQKGRDGAGDCDTRVLITTYIWARGLDVQQTTVTTEERVRVEVEEQSLTAGSADHHRHRCCRLEKNAHGDEMEAAMREQIETEKRAAAWEEAEKFKHTARYKHEEIKIQAWESVESKTRGGDEEKRGI
ncbi:hypothetical protein RHMOL_Rhmol09G0135000 [Rhododendron molle]|uniref:Uncharacterized protein n=1 Tax=Rhododendron molle TaxID=49168 RepID=A0ACC0MDC6_RHOML|nr:hypothetical protein RHMOL_Rhmol09G0135000 [Rhododendron molle]